MKAPDRWPLHPAPIDGEALSSWLRRIAAGYHMDVAELLEHGLGRDAQAACDLDADPPPGLLAALGQRTGIAANRLHEMTLAGWTPWLLDSLKPHPSAFDTYARQFSVLLKPGKRSKHAAGPWRAWMPRDQLRRACPRCIEDPGRGAGLLLIWQLPLTLSCPEHRVMLEPCIGFPGEFIVWIDDGDPPRAASVAVVEMDHRTHQALQTGQIRLPGRSVHAGVWFRLLRSILDEVSTPATYWGSHADDLRRIWAGCGHPIRAGQATWRPFEVWPWPVQTQLLEAAAEAIQFLEDRTITGRGAHANLFAPAPHPPVDDGRPSPAAMAAEDTLRWERLRSALEEAVQAAREDPADAQALYDLLVIGCRTPQATERMLANLDELGVPTDHLSHKKHVAPFA